MRTGYEIQKSEIQALLPMSSVILDKSLEYLELQFPNLPSGSSRILARAPPW